MKLSWWSACLVVVGLAGAAAAEEVVTYNGKEYRGLPEARWGKLSTKDFGQHYFVEGRWQQVHGSGLVLFKAPVDTRAFLNIGAGPLKDNLVAGLSGMGKKLQRRRSRVRVFGQASRGGRGVYLSVIQVLKLSDPAEAYLERLAQSGQDAGAIAALAKECAAEAARYEDEDLAEVARQIGSKELEARARALAADDYTGYFALARRFQTEARDATNAIALYSKVAEASEAPEKFKKAALQALAELQAVRVRTGAEDWGWVTYAEFKRSEGYLLRRPKEGEPYYIRREQAELLEVIASETQRQEIKIDPPRQNPFKSGQDARTGKIQRGQTCAEVRTAAGGFPVRVLHHITRWGPKSRALWTQWELVNGGRVYFLSIESTSGGQTHFPPGEVVERRPAGTPWPTE